MPESLHALGMVLVPAEQTGIGHRPLSCLHKSAQGMYITPRHLTLTQDGSTLMVPAENTINKPSPDAPRLYAPDGRSRDPRADKCAAAQCSSLRISHYGARETASAEARVRDDGVRGTWPWRPQGPKRCQERLLAACGPALQPTQACVPHPKPPGGPDCPCERLSSASPAHHPCTVPHANRCISTDQSLTWGFTGAWG